MWHVLFHETHLQYKIYLMYEIMKIHFIPCPVFVIIPRDQKRFWAIPRFPHKWFKLVPATSWTKRNNKGDLSGNVFPAFCVPSGLWLLRSKSSSVPRREFVSPHLIYVKLNFFKQRILSPVVLQNLRKKGNLCREGTKWKSWTSHV